MSPRDPGRGRGLPRPGLAVWALTGALIAAACVGAPERAAAQAKSEPPPGQPKPPPAAQARPPTPPQLVVPPAESLVLLIRSTLLSLNDAIHTGNYTVLRDLASPSFREANSAARLVQIFSGLAAQRIDLSAVAILTPKLTQVPGIDQDSRLHIEGYFPAEPIELHFKLMFEAVAGRWRLFGVSVSPTKSANAQAAPAAGAPPAPASPAAGAADRKKPAAQPGKADK